jgi:hypothetical protein
MSTTSKYAMALDLVKDKLSDDKTFNVINVFTKETALSNTKANVYVNLISDTLTPLNTESGFRTSIRRLLLGIYAVQKNSLDSQELGTAAIMHGQLSEKIDKAMDAVEATLPYSDVTSAGYTVTLHSIETGNVTGYVDDKSDKVGLLYEVTISYLQQA